MSRAWVLEKRLKTCSSFVCKGIVEGFLSKKPYYYHHTDKDKAMKFTSKRHASMFKDSDLPGDFNGYEPVEYEFPDRADEASG